MLVNNTRSKALLSRLQSKPLNSATGDLGRVLYGPPHVDPGGLPGKPAQVSTAPAWSPGPELHVLARRPARAGAARAGGRGRGRGQGAGRSDARRGGGAAPAQAACHGGRLSPAVRESGVGRGLQAAARPERVSQWDRWGGLRAPSPDLRSCLGPEASDRQSEQVTKCCWSLNL